MTSSSDGTAQSTSGTDRLRPQCFNTKCDESFESVDEMVAVPGRGDRCPRHFCEPCAERIRRGPPLTDGGRDEDRVEHCDDCKAPLEDHEQGFCPHQIETGERYAESELTGNRYLVTKWAEKDDGHIVSLRKVEIGRSADTGDQR